MRLSIFKALMLMALGTISGGIFAPWIISNAVLPVWANILLLSMLLFGGVCLIEVLYRKLFRSLKSDIRNMADDISKRDPR